MSRTKGSPNKPKEESHNPDQWNSREHVMNNYNETQENKPEMECSVPIGEMAFESEGLAPRSRSPFTRESERRQHYINKYERAVIETRRGKTYMPDENIPEGLVFMWARKTVRGRADDRNIPTLESEHGWRAADASDFSSYAYRDDYGNLNDSSSKIYLGGLQGMVRDKEIHEAQLRHYARLRSQSDRQYSDFRSTNDGSPRAANNMESYNEQFFPSIPEARSHSTY